MYIYIYIHIYTHCIDICIVDQSPLHLSHWAAASSISARLFGTLLPENSLLQGYRGTSLIRKRIPLRPYRRPMPRVLGGS